MKRILIVFLSVLVYSMGYGQTNDGRPADIHNNPSIQGYLTGEKELPVYAESKASEYFGYENQIAELLIDEKSFAGIPTSNGYTSKSEYLKTLNKWISENQTLVKADQRNKILITE